MKYILVLLLAVSTGFSLNAQDVVSKMANGTCDCLKKNKVAEKGKENLELELGLCMIEQVGLYKDALKKAGYNPDQPNFYETMGEKLGLELAVSCPYFMSIVTDMLQDENSGLREKVGERMSEKYGVTLAETQSMTGVVQSVEYGDFVKIAVKDSEGKRKEFYWINSFGGDDKIMLMDSPDLLIGKSISVEYVEGEIYFHKLKFYLGIKKIASLVVNQ